MLQAVSSNLQSRLGALPLYLLEKENPEKN